MSLLQLRLRVHPAQEAEALAFAWTLGVNGLEVHDADTGAPAGVLELRLYLDPSVDLPSLEAAAAAALGPGLHLEARPLTPPAARSAPSALGEGFRVLPLGSRARPGRRRPLHVDPGLAWGDGRHGSTRAAARLLERTALDGQRVLDLGCGSGLLGLIAAHLGANVTAVDTDGLARRATGAAFAAAGLPVTVADHLPPGARFDLAVANLPAVDLLPALPALEEAVAPGGALLLSGLPAGAWGAVGARLPGWNVAAQARSGGWSARRFTRP